MDASQALNNSSLHDHTQVSLCWPGIPVTEQQLKMKASLQEDARSSGRDGDPAWKAMSCSLCPPPRGEPRGLLAQQSFPLSPKESAGISAWG